MNGALNEACARAAYYRTRAPTCNTLHSNHQVRGPPRHGGGPLAQDFRHLQLSVDAEGNASAAINEVKDLLLEPAMGAERPIDVEMAVDVVARAEVHLRAPFDVETLSFALRKSNGRHWRGGPTS